MVLPTGNNMDTKKHAAKARMSHDKDNEVDTQRVIEDVNNRKEWQEVRNAVESVVVRSLRRRLWRACRTEDPIAALQCYTATRSVWEEWRRQEIVQEQTAAAQHQHNNSKGHSHPLEGFRPWRKKTQSSVKHQHSAAAAAASPPLGSQAAASISSEVLSDSNTNTTNTALGVVGLLQIHMNPSDLFVLDDYKDPIRDGYQQPDDFYDEQQERQLGQQNWKDKCRSVVSRIGVTRQAFVLPSSTPASPATTVDQEELSSSRQYSNITNIHNKNSNLLEADILMMMTTTPLHEAARMGHGALFQCMLSAASQASSSSLSYVDLDTRNGAGRTVLHCAAGGITAAEASFLALRRKKLNFDVDDDDEDDNSSGQEMDVGIPAPRPPLAAIESERKDTFSNRNLKGSVLNVARTFGKWAKFQRVPTPSLQRDDEQHTNSNAATLESDANHSGPAQQAQRDSDRMDVVKSILSWTRAGTNEACASMAIMPTVDQGGVSINSVDLSFGRTALHYGAELGRSDLCQAILQSFYGTMLTVIDCTGRTPCELAGAGGFAHLATYLEARALLFVDPYGTDEDLLTAITAQSPESNDTNNRGILPFSWFETLRLPEVQLRRERRLVQSLEKTRQIAQRLRLRHFARNTIVEDMQQANDDNSGSAALPTKESSDFRLGGDINDKDKEAVVVDRPVPTDSTIKGDKSKDNDFNMYEDQLHEAHIESFLTFHSWDVTKALEAFSSDPFEAFQTAGILLPQCKAQRESSSSKKQICLICCDEFDSTSVSWKQLSGCCHSFCADCLEDYLTECSKSRTGVVVPCPHHDCNMLMSPWEIQMLSPYDVHSALVQSANDNYVVSANDLRFCPHPGCGQKGAIRMTLPEHLDSPKLARSGLLQLVGAVCTNVYDEQSPNRNATSSLTGYKADFPAASYDGVVDPSYYNLFNLKQPKKAHRFCFHCGDQKIHWPVTCERLSEWKATIAAQVKTVHGDEEQKLENGEANIFEDVAQKLWMKANTRPCPQCKAPIQKNDGCNHMTCSNPLCKREFCWICMCEWQLHNTDTGGFFRCNRWVENIDDHVPYGEIPSDIAETATLLADATVDPRTMEATYGTAMHETRIAKQRSMNMDRFLHHYARWNAHAESARLERRMGDAVCFRLAPVVDEALKFHGDEYIFGGKGLSFIHDAFLELFECRSMLQHSYAFSFTRYKSTNTKKYKLTKRHISEKLAFEQSQSVLELMTEQISDVVARSHIRATQTQITFLTAVTSEKRKEFSNLMINILLDEQKEDMREKRKDASGPVHSLSHGLDTIVGLASGIQRSTETMQTQGALSRTVSSDSDHAAESAVRESLQEFLTNTGSASLYEYTSDDDEMADFTEWPCSACTYVNTGGIRCDICQTAK